MTGIIHTNTVRAPLIQMKSIHRPWNEPRQRNSRTAVETEIDCWTKTKWKKRRAHSACIAVARNERANEWNEWRKKKICEREKNARAHHTHTHTQWPIAKEQFCNIFGCRIHISTTTATTEAAAQPLPIRRMRNGFRSFMQSATGAHSALSAHFIHTHNICALVLLRNERVAEHFISFHILLNHGWSAIHKRNRAKRKTKTQLYNKSRRERKKSASNANVARFTYFTSFSPFHSFLFHISFYRERKETEQHQSWLEWHLSASIEHLYFLLDAEKSAQEFGINRI